MNKEEKVYSKAQQRTLLAIARSSIQHGLDTGSSIDVNLDNFARELRLRKAVFVTLTLAGKLRGCTGTTRAERALVENVAKHAYASAFSDSRFVPLRQAELREAIISVSILTTPRAIKFDSEEALLEQIVPYQDGLIIESGQRSATFLPTVWKSLPAPADFLAHLKEKAGLRERDELNSAWRYETTEFHEC